MIDFAQLAPREKINPATGRREGEHAIVFGITGFGKSYLMARLARLRRYVVVHDAKGTWYAPGFARETSLKKVIDSRANRLIYAPDRHELRDDGAKEAFFEWCYRRGQTTVIVDELTSVTTTRHDMPDALYDLLARGREFGCEVWSGTQEPSWIPQLCITQARNRYCFYIAFDQHQKKVCSVMPGLSVPDILCLQERQFYFYREGSKRIDDRGPFEVTPRSDRVIPAA